MIISGHMLVELSPGVAGIRRGAVRIDGGRIAEVFDGDKSPRADLGGEGWLITPGFVDAHLHLPQFDSIGRAGMTLLDWLDAVIFSAEAKWADTAYAGAMGERVAQQLIRHGTTAVAAYGTVHHQGTVAAMRALSAAGLAGVVGQVLMDRGAPAELIAPASRLLEEAARLPTLGRIAPAVTPRFALSCSWGLLEGAGRLAGVKKWPVQTHLAETQAECQKVSELFSGSRYVQVYERAGLLRRGALLGHGIFLDDADRDLIAKAGAVVAHCPTANAFLRSGDMDFVAHRSRAVPLALGSDIAGGFERSMVRVGRSALETGARVHPERVQPSAAWAWWQITTGNGAAIGRPELGRLAVGADADVLVIQPDIRWLDSPAPLATLMYAWDDRWLKRTVIGGRVGFEA